MLRVVSEHCLTNPDKSIWGEYYLVSDPSDLGLYGSL